MMEQMKNSNNTSIKNIFDANQMNIYLIIVEGNHGADDSDGSTCHGYYIINGK